MAGRLIIISLLLPLLLADRPASAADNQKMTLALEELNEVVRDGALIAGAVVIGVQVRNASDQDLTLSSYIPSHWGGQTVCAKVVSADGLYEAIGPYSVPVGWSGGAAELPFPTKHGELLRSLPEDGIGVLVSHGECGKQEGAVKTIALWNSDQASSVDIVLNSFRADSVFAYVGDQPAPVLCKRVVAGGGTSFDTKCNLQAEGLAGQTQVEIYRVVGGKPSKPTALEIWFPSASE